MCCPLCTLKRLLLFFFPVFLFCLWELRFKSLTNVFVCWTVEMTRLSTDVAQELCCLAASGSFYIVLWDLTVFPTGQGYLGLRALTPTPPKKNKNKKKNLTVKSINHLQQTSYLLYRSSVECVCHFPKKTIFGCQTSVLLNHVCVFTPQRSVFAVFSCCSSSDARVLLQIL